MKRTVLIPLHRLPAKLPKRRNGKRIHISTVYRWTTRGIDGVVLSTTQVGNLRCTTPEMLQTFFQALAAKRQRQPPSQSTPHDRDNLSATQARQALNAAGISLDKSCLPGNRADVRGEG